MKRINVKQGTLAWEKARQNRIGGSEVFDIVRYYATDQELQNCGFNAEDFRSEKPYTTAWALYHKVLNDGLYHKEELAPEFAEYGHAIEPYGVYVMNRRRVKKLKPGRVYADERLIASLDAEGIAEECDIVPFDYGNGKPKLGQRFACEQKSMMPDMVKRGVPFKYIVQAQYQIQCVKAHFFILQVMILDTDTPFIRGKICQMSRQKRYEYLDEHLKVLNLYFANNEHLGRLIEVSLERFFDDVENRREPTPFIKYDSTKNIIESIRLNSAFNKDAVVECDLQAYIDAKRLMDFNDEERKVVLQCMVELAKVNNACKFKGQGYTAFFDKAGRFHVKEEKVCS